MPDRAKKDPLFPSYAGIILMVIFCLVAVVGIRRCLNPCEASRSMTFKSAHSVRNSAEIAVDDEGRKGTAMIARVIPLKRQEGVRLHLRRSASLAPRQEVEIAPQPKLEEMSIAPSSGATSNVRLLPQVFDGCWSGSVEKLDSIDLFRPPQVTLWVTKTYRLCYQRDGNGSSQPTLTEAGLNREIASRLGTEVGNVIGHLKVVSTDFRTKAEMRAFLHFNERPRNPQSFRFPVGLVDELTTLDCQIDGVTMHVEAQVYGEYDTTPWFTGSWHADFFRLAP